ncbi:hypothetical protein ACWDYK_10640 [Streptomyces anthocyanicus]
MPTTAGTAAGQEPAVPLPGPRHAPVPDDVDRATLMTPLRPAEVEPTTTGATRSPRRHPGPSPSLSLTPRTGRRSARRPTRPVVDGTTWSRDPSVDIDAASQGSSPTDRRPVRSVPGSSGAAKSPRRLRVSKTPTTGRRLRMPKQPVSPAYVRTSAVQALARDPKAFLRDNVVMTDQARGLAVYAPLLSPDERNKIVKALDLPFVDQHWFVAVEVGRDVGRKRVFVLAPALEKYAAHYPNSAFGDVPSAKLPVTREDAAYLQAAHLPHLTGSTGDLDARIGHVDVAREPTTDAFSPDFVITPTTTGGALAVTAAADPAKFTAWCFPSRPAHSDIDNAERFRREKNPYAWYGGGEYHRGDATSSMNGRGRPFDTTSMLWRGPDGWQVLSQESRAGRQADKVAFRAFHDRPIRWEPDSGPRRQVAFPASEDAATRADDIGQSSAAEAYRGALADYHEAIRDQAGPSASPDRPGVRLQEAATLLVTAARELHQLGVDVFTAQGGTAVDIPPLLGRLHSEVRDSASGTGSVDASTDKWTWGALVMAWTGGGESAARAVATALTTSAVPETHVALSRALRGVLPGGAAPLLRNDGARTAVGVAIKDSGLDDLPEDLVGRAWTAYSALRLTRPLLDAEAMRRLNDERSADLRAIVDAAMEARGSGSGRNPDPAAGAAAVILEEAGRVVAVREGLAGRTTPADMGRLWALRDRSPFYTGLVDRVGKHLAYDGETPAPVDPAVLVRLFSNLDLRNRTADIDTLAATLASLYLATSGGGVVSADGGAMSRDDSDVATPRPVRTPEPFAASMEAGEQDHTGPLDLTDLLVSASERPGADTVRPHLPVAEFLLERAGGRQALEDIVLTLDLERLNALSVRRIAVWAADTLRADLARTGTSADDTTEARLTDYERIAAEGLTASQDAGTFLASAIDTVGTVRAGFADAAGPTPLRPPTTYEVGDRDAAEHLLHRLARRLGTRLRVDLRLPGNEQYTRWADPDGTIHAFDPADASNESDVPTTSTSDGKPLTSRQAQDAGLLTAAERRTVEELGFDAEELGAVYRSSWQHRRTFAQAMRLEAASRREALTVLDPRLPDLLPRLLAATAETQRSSSHAPLPDPHARRANDADRVSVRSDNSARKAAYDLLTVVRGQESATPLDTLVDAAETLFPPSAAPQEHQPPTATTSEDHTRLTIEEIMNVSVVARNDRLEPVAVWLPGADPAAPGHTDPAVQRFDQFTSLGMATTTDGHDRPAPGMTLVFGAESDDDRSAGGPRVSVEAMASALAQAAPGRIPLLMTADAEVLAARLAQRLGMPVAAARFGAVLHPESGTLSEASGSGPREGDGFRLYTPDQPQGVPFFTELRADPWDPSTRTGPARAEMETETVPKAGAADRMPQPDPGPTGRLLAEGEPLDLPPAIRTIGVPRAGLPFLPQVITQLRDLARAQNLTVAESVWTALPQRLLSNYRYLVPGQDDLRSETSGPGGWRTGLPVSLGRGVEALITLNPVEPRFVRFPAGSHDRPVGPHEEPAGPGAAAPSLETIPEEDEGETSPLKPSTATEQSGMTEQKVTPEQGPLPLLTTRADPDTDPFHANQTIKGSYLTGAHVQTHSGPTGVTRAGVTVSFGLGLGLPGLDAFRLSAGVSGSANASSRSTSHVADAEGGHVEVGDVDSTLLAYRAEWSVKLRADSLVPWKDITAADLRTTGDERLMLDVPEHYLGTPGPQITASGTGEAKRRIPRAYFASGLTGLPSLMDNIVKSLTEESALAGRRLDLTSGTPQHGELVQKLWNLDAHLDEAVNDRYGYRFDLHDGNQVIASVEVHTKRITRGTPVGATTDKGYVENVRTAIDGGNGSHNLTQSSSVSLTASADLGPRGRKFGFSLPLSWSWSTTDSVSAGRVGLWVLVPRYIGFTTAYDVEFTHTSRVAVKNRPPVNTAPVPGRALVRIPEPKAFEHGFPVETAALRGEHTAGSNGDHLDARTGATVRYADARSLVRRTGRREGDPEQRALPSYIEELGKGIGMGLADVGTGTISDVSAWLGTELKRTGFLPAEPTTPLTSARWYSHRAKRESLMENQKLFDKFVGQRGFDSHYDQIHQTGLSFTLALRRGALATDFAASYATVTIRANHTMGPDGKRLQSYEGSTDTRASVNLAMGMGTAGQSVSGNQRVSVGFRARIPFQLLQSAGHGFDIFRQLGASQGVNYLHNRPELMEYRGPLHHHTLYSDYTVEVTYGHSGVPMRGQRRAPRLYKLTKQPSEIFLLPLGDISEPGISRSDSTPASVLKQAAVFFLDATDLHEAATGILRGLTGPAGNADQELKSFTGTIDVRAFAKEIFRDATARTAEQGARITGFDPNPADGTTAPPGSVDAPVAVDGPDQSLSVTGAAEYTTDQFFAPGFFRDTTAGVDISGRMNRALFAQATDNPFVLGVILLAMGQMSAGDNSGYGMKHVQADATVGGPVPVGDENTPGSLRGGADASRNWQWNTSRGEGRTGAKEYIQLDFNRAYAFQTSADFTVRSRLEKHGKLAFAHSDHDTRQVQGKTMLFVHSEPTALDEYGKGHLPVSDRQLVDVMGRWRRGEVRLRGDTVAGVLTRWTQDTPHLTAELADLLGIDRAGLATLLAELHKNGALVIRDDAIREAFAKNFGLTVSEGPDVYADLSLPEYLTREDPGGRTLGHSGVHDLAHEGGRTTFEIVREQVDKVAPGLLASKPEVWFGQGRRIGRIQGGVNSLQAILARGRDMSFWDDFLSTNGLSLYFVNPVGWLLADVVEINLSSVLTSAPHVEDFLPSTGLENYSHAYVDASESRSRDGAQAVTAARLGGGEGHTSDTASLGFGEGHHRGVRRAETATTEQTVYDWTGHYRVRMNETFTVRVRRVDTAGRPLNSYLLGLYRSLDAHRSMGSSIEVPGVLVLQIPRGLAEHKKVFGPQLPRDPRPLPELPGDAYVTGTMLDDALPVGRKLLARMFGPKADGATTRTALTIGELLGRTQMNNHLRDAVAGKRDLLTDLLFVPGRSRRRARLWLRGDLYDLQVLGPVQGTGTGRYSKHQSGTSHTASHDSIRPAAALGLAGSNEVPVHGTDVKKLTPGTDTEISRTTDSSQAGSGTENYRREEHVKQQGPVYLVRMRARLRFEAERYNRNLLFPDRTQETYTSETFTGDVYAELFQKEIAELRVRHAATAYDPGIGNDLGWLDLDDAPVFDLTTLLARAATVRGAERAHQLVARVINQQSSTAFGHAVLTFDTAALDRHTVVETYRWAVDTLTEEVTRRRSVDLTVREPEALVRYRRLLADDRPEAELPGTRDPDATLLAIGHQVQAARREITGDESLGPAPMPAIQRFRATDHTHLIRGIAHELQAHLRVDFTREGRPLMTRWVEPTGQVHAFEPTGGGRPGAKGLTAEQAERAGLLTPDLRHAVDLLDLDDRELGRLYGTSTREQADFAEMVRLETEIRRGRLAALDPRLPELLDRAAVLAGTTDPAEHTDDVSAEEAGLALEILQDLARAPWTPSFRSFRPTAGVEYVLDLLLPKASEPGGGAQSARDASETARSATPVPTTELADELSRTAELVAAVLAAAASSPTTHTGTSDRAPKERPRPGSHHRFGAFSALSAFTKLAADWVVRTLDVRGAVNKASEWFSRGALRAKAAWAGAVARTNRNLATWKRAEGLGSDPQLNASVLARETPPPPRGVTVPTLHDGRGTTRGDSPDAAVGPDIDDRVWYDHLETDGQGTRPSLSKQSDGFPRTRIEAWADFLRAHDRLHGGGGLGESAADQLLFSRARSAMVRWGHEHPENLVTAHRQWRETGTVPPVGATADAGPGGSTAQPSQGGSPPPAEATPTPTPTPTDVPTPLPTGSARPPTTEAAPPQGPPPLQEGAPPLDLSPSQDTVAGRIEVALLGGNAAGATEDPVLGRGTQQNAPSTDEAK